MSGGPGPRFWNEETQRWEDAEGTWGQGSTGSAGGTGAVSPVAPTAPVTPPPPPLPDSVPEWTTADVPGATGTAPPPPAPPPAPPPGPAAWPAEASTWHGRAGTGADTRGRCPAPTRAVDQHRCARRAAPSRGSAGESSGPCSAVPPWSVWS
ncbi:hypothetical protein ACRAWF_34145 [Streptomyces sp. L7]